ncbi:MULTISPECIES: lmo0937 family membrane protein [unclassified Bacillus (in: firmicutes)]|nr:MULTISPECIES: lmo0937 family membrane protein [unclassified Bacillus (in: firmicutes)]
MLWTILAVLLVLWVLGLVFNIAGGLIHILLVVAAVIFLFNMLKGRANR